MKKYYVLLVLVGTVCLWTSCTENTNTVNAGNLPQENNPPIPEDNSNPGTTQTPSEPVSTPPKTDAEIALEAGVFATNVALELIEQQKIKNSNREANREKMYAYQIGMQMKEKDAFKAYNDLVDSKVPSIYVFKAGRKEYYIVKFEAKGEEELKTSYGDFKSQLGANGTEGLKVINLMDFCTKRETVAKDDVSEGGIVIECLTCN